MTQPPDGPVRRPSGRRRPPLLERCVGAAFAIPALAVLVPPNYLATSALLCVAGARTSVRGSVAVVVGYFGWMAWTDGWKRSVDAVGPDWLAAAIQKLLQLAMLGCGCTSEVVMEWTPEARSAARQVVCCYNPHGAFSTAGICFAMGQWRLHPELRQVNGSLVGASVLFFVPVLRELLLVLGVREATRPTMEALLRSGKSVGMQPGGVWEQLHTDHRQEQAFCMPNLGFIRLAIRHGLALVPVYAFGEASLYTTWPFGLGLRRWIAKRFRMGVPLVTGALGFFPLVPHPTHVVLVSGRPVPVGPRTDQPTDAQLEDVLARYEAELQRLFERYKDTALPPEVHSSPPHVQCGAA